MIVAGFTGIESVDAGEADEVIAVVDEPAGVGEIAGRVDFVCIVKINRVVWPDGALDIEGLMEIGWVNFEELEPTKSGTRGVHDVIEHFYSLL